MSGNSGAALSDKTSEIRVLVADDHALFRRGLNMVIGEESDICVVGEAHDGAEAVAMAEELVPDVMLMDVRMPKLNGIEAAAKIRDSVPHTRILMLTVSDEDQDLFEALKAGAAGYLLKEISIDEIAEAIRQVHKGQSLISPTMAAKLIAEFTSLAKLAENPSAHVEPPKLTDREHEVLQCVAQGMSNREIAEKLYISENTVKNHVRNILEKLHLHSRMEAVIYAVREKILEI